MLRPPTDPVARRSSVMLTDDRDALDVLPGRAPLISPISVAVACWIDRTACRLALMLPSLIIWRKRIGGEIGGLLP